MVLMQDGKRQRALHGNVCARVRVRVCVYVLFVGRHKANQWFPNWRVERQPEGIFTHPQALAF